MEREGRDRVIMKKKKVMRKRVNKRLIIFDF
jgi:hypothetical protein